MGIHSSNKPINIKASRNKPINTKASIRIARLNFIISDHRFRFCYPLVHGLDTALQLLNVAIVFVCYLQRPMVADDSVRYHHLKSKLHAFGLCHLGDDRHIDTACGCVCQWYADGE